MAGHGADDVRAAVHKRSGNIEIVIQEPQLGTGHAVAQCLDTISGFEGTVVVLSGDVPGLKTATVKAWYRQEWRKKQP